MARSRSDASRRFRQSERLARVLRLLQLILGIHRWDAGSIARELGCSERSVYRDLQVLELAGVPWWYDEGGRSYRVRPDFRFPVLNLTEEEVLGQAVATALAGAPGLVIGPGAGPTTRRLAVVSGTTTRRILADAEQLIVALDLKLADHSRHHEKIRTIQGALLQRRQLDGRYRSPYQEREVPLRLHPYRLCLSQQAWYLIARPDHRDDPRTYRVTRFASLRMEEPRALVPTDFDLRAYFGDAWGVYRGNQSYEVEVAFTPAAAPLVTETTWHHTQQAHHQADGGVTLMFRVDGLSEIVWWVLGWAGRVRVVRPPELRALVLEQLRSALEMNEDPDFPRNVSTPLPPKAQ